MTKPKLGKSSDGRPMHFSVAAIIEKDGKFLVIDRTKPPLGFAFPAGHVNEGETALEAVKREVMEEVGLTVTEAHLLLEEEESVHTCKKGIDAHYWNIFECKVAGDARRASYEAKTIKWYSLNEMKEMVFDITWQHWFTKLELFKNIV